MFQAGSGRTLRDPGVGKGGRSFGVRNACPLLLGFAGWLRAQAARDRGQPRFFKGPPLLRLAGRPSRRIRLAGLDGVGGRAALVPRSLRSPSISGKSDPQTSSPRRSSPVRRSSRAGDPAGDEACFVGHEIGRGGRSLAPAEPMGGHFEDSLGGSAAEAEGGSRSATIALAADDSPWQIAGRHPIRGARRPARGAAA